MAAIAEKRTSHQKNPILPERAAWGVLPAAGQIFYILASREPLGVVAKCERFFRAFRRRLPPRRG